MTSREWSVSSAAQSRNDERKPCTMAGMRCFQSRRRSRLSWRRFPRSLGNTTGLPSSASARAASRISMARRHRRTRWSRFIFIRSAGTVPLAASRVDLGPHGPADLARPRDRQDQELERSLPTPGPLRRPQGPDRRRDLAVRQRPPALDDLVLRAEHRQDPVGGLSFLRFMATAHSSTAMRRRTVRAVCILTCQMGVRTRSTSISEGSTSTRTRWLPTRNPEAAYELLAGAPCLRHTDV